MMIYKAYKIEIKPNNKQIALLNQSIGCARFVYNWGLDRSKTFYSESKMFLSGMDLHKELCKIKRSQFPWMYKVSKCAAQESLRDLDTAFNKFLKNRKLDKKCGFPKFKSKHADKSSYRVSNASVYITHTTIKLPKIPGTIKLKEKGYIPTKGVTFISFVISKKADKWFVSARCKIENVPFEGVDEVIGIDLGLKSLAVISDGTVYKNPRAYNKFEHKLNKIQRQRCRRVKGSKNRQKSINRLKKIQYKVSCIRNDITHKMTSSLMKTKPRTIVIEDLSVKNMLKNHKLAKILSDASFGEIRRQFEYKALWYGSEIIVADRFFPSSKICSSCGLIKEDLTLKDRVYRCECGLILDRDINAALNLKRYGEFHRNLYKNKACGEEKLQSEAA